MVNSCCAYGCTERFRKESPYTFHRFPRNENLRKLWEKSIRRQDFVATEASRICSKHFEPHCFNTEKQRGTWLNPDAVPTLFDSPSHDLDQKMSKEKEVLEECSVGKRKLKKYCCLGDFTEKDMNLLINLKKKQDVKGMLNLPKAKRYSYLGDFNEEDMNSPEKSRKVLQLAKTLELENRKIKRKNKSLVKKVTSLKAVINEMKRKYIIPGNVFKNDLHQTVSKNVDNINTKNVKKNAATDSTDRDFSGVNITDNYLPSTSL